VKVVSLNYFMPTRIVAGHGVLRNLPGLLSELGVRKPMVFTDPAIAKTSFFQLALDDLANAGVAFDLSDQCPVDARLTHMDAEARRMIDAGIDGVVGIGGGSVMCAAKGAALAATNGGAVGPLRGRFSFAHDPLPMIMVPTTAGSGSEASQWTVAKDDIEHRKFSVGGPQNFPRVAILDPVTLETLPPRVAALAAIDALTHAVEAFFTNMTSPISDALALDAAGRLFRSLRESILGNDPEARLDNLVGSTMANMACTNAGLGLCHSLSSPMESTFNIVHAVGVGALLPRVLAFNAEAAPERARAIATAFGVAPDGPLEVVTRRAVTALEALYADLGLPSRIDPDLIDVSRIEEMAVLAVTAISRGRKPVGPITADTTILCPNLRAGTVADGIRLYEASIGR
jgi:alcohol dehydrogenase class IV